MQLTNTSDVSLPLAVWLAGDGYDFKRGTRKAISATSLLKGVRKILLAERLSEEDSETPDVTDFIASRLGHSIHDSIEKAWTHDYASAMAKLGYPKQVIDRVAINPRRVTPDMIPIYLEQRVEKTLMGYAITGKYDMILEGVLQDFKTTSVYTAIYGGKDEDYKLQGSIYRWLNQDKVTADHMVINFVFTDWSRAEARRNVNYPQSRVQPRRIELYSVSEIEAWMRRKIKALEAAADLPEAELPRCSDEELWRGDAVWKVYADMAKANDPNSRSLKNCSSHQEAQEYVAAKGKGVIIEIPGKVKACGYCPAFPICTQKDEYEHG